MNPNILKPETPAAKFKRSVELATSWFSSKKSEAVKNFIELAMLPASEITWQAQAWLGRCYLDKKDLNQAVFWLRQAILNAPKDLRTAIFQYKKQHKHNSNSKPVDKEALELLDSTITHLEKFSCPKMDTIPNNYEIIGLITLSEYCYHHSSLDKYQQHYREQRSWEETFLDVLTTLHGWNGRFSTVYAFVDRIMQTPKPENYIHLLGRITPSSLPFEQAIRLETLKIFGNTGHQYAYYYIGQACLFSSKPDYTQAHFWFRKAAEYDYSKAQEFGELIQKEIARLSQENLASEDKDISIVYNVNPLFAKVYLQEAGNPKYDSDNGFKGCLLEMAIATCDYWLSDTGNNPLFEGTQIENSKIQKLKMEAEGLLAGLRSSWDEEIQQVAAYRELIGFQKPVARKENQDKLAHVEPNAEIVEQKQDIQLKSAAVASLAAASLSDALNQDKKIAAQKISDKPSIYKLPKVSYKP